MKKEQEGGHRMCENNKGSHGPKKVEKHCIRRHGPEMNIDLDLNPADFQIYIGFELINSAQPDLDSDLILLFEISLQLSVLFRNCRFKITVIIL